MSRLLRLQVDHNSLMPLVAQISQQLTYVIVGGSLREGDELPPIQELADEVGVNLHTVRAAYQLLESRGLVSLGRGRRARVLAYDRQRWLDTPSRAPSHIIGVIIPEFTQFYAPLLRAIEDEAAQDSTMVLLANAHNDVVTAQHAVDRLLARGVDGIIIAVGLLGPDPGLPTNGPPIVFVDAPGSPGPSIEFDLERSQYLATSHLVEHQHNKIGYITPPRYLANVAPKVTGHERALTEAGLDPTSQPTVGVEGFTIQFGQNAARQLLDTDDPPTAITVASDQLAVGVYHAAKQLGIDIPTELAVTANDNSELAIILDPGLTTVSLPLQEAGRLATRSIRDAQDGTAPPLRVTLDAELVIRRSCGCQP